VEKDMIVKRTAGTAALALMFVAPLLLVQMGVADAQSVSESASGEHVEGGVPLSRLIAIVSKKTGKKFVIDPRVHAEVVLVGQEPDSISYNDLLTILITNGFAAFEEGGYVTVMTDANVRQQILPLATGKEHYPDSAFVSAVIVVKNVPAAQLVPILRPMLPQYAHLAALPCSNRLILVERFAKVQSMRAIIDSLDVGEPYKPEKCDYWPQQTTPAAQKAP
jgi:general secretion pathway protein D